MATRSFERTARTPGSSRHRSIHQTGDADTSMAGGVRWLGIEDGGDLIEGGRATPREAGRKATLVFGSTHGPRLLEIVGACAG
jgi:hypothetical protein